MKWLRISSTEDENWNWFTWLVLVFLFVVYGSMAEFFFGSWSWALNMVGLGFGAVGDAADFGPNGLKHTAGGVSLVLWLCLLIPMLLTGLPAVASLLGLSLLFNPSRDESEN